MVSIRFSHRRGYPTNEYIQSNKLTSHISSSFSLFSSNSTACSNALSASYTLENSADRSLFTNSL